jgi:hypothetical protein
MKLFAYALILAILAPTNVLAGGLRALVLSVSGFLLYTS